MKKLILAVAALAFSGGAMAGPSWTYVDAGYIVGDSNDNEFAEGDTDGYSISGSLGGGLIGLDLFHAQLDYGSLDFQDSSNDTIGLSIGVHPSITDNTDLTLDLGFSNIDDDDSDAEADVISLSAGIRSMISDNVELSASIAYNMIDPDADGAEDQYDVAFSAGGQYLFNDNIGLGLEWTQQDFVDTDDYGSVDLARLYVRWSF